MGKQTETENQTSVASLSADYYSKRYKVWDAIGDFRDVIIKHDNKKYFLY